MKQLGEYLQYNEYVEELRLEDNKITDKGVEILSEYMMGNTILKKLVFQNIEGITDESIPYLVKIIESSYIEYLSVSGTSMTQNQPIIVSLAGNHIKCGLNNLHLHSDICDEDIIKICGYMKEYGIDKLKSIVTRCRIRSNKITSKGASVLFGTLKECNSVAQTVEFRDNLIDNEFMQSLGEYLQDDEHIEILRLTGNEIADEGVEILSQYMIGNTTLKELNLRGNKGITDASIQSLIDAVKSSHMIYIGIYETSISKEKQNEIYEIVKIPINERQIHTKSNTKSAAKIS